MIIHNYNDDINVNINDNVNDNDNDNIIIDFQLLILSTTLLFIISFIYINNIIIDRINYI